MAYTVSIKVKVGGEVKTVSVKRTYQTKEAATKAGERLLNDVKASGMTSVGSFVLRNSSGKEVRPFMSKDAYNNLYYWVIGDVVRNVRYNPDEILKYASRRYDTLDQARKGAVNKSKDIWNELFYVRSDRAIDVLVFKGKKHIGTVTYNVLKGRKPMFDGYEGIWSWADNPDDEMRIKSDGSLI